MDDRFTVAIDAEEQASAMALRKDRQGLRPSITIEGEHFLVSYDADHSADVHITRVTRPTTRQTESRNLS